MSARMHEAAAKEIVRVARACWAAEGGTRTYLVLGIVLFSATAKSQEYLMSGIVLCNRGPDMISDRFPVLFLILCIPDTWADRPMGPLAIIGPKGPHGKMTKIG